MERTTDVGLGDLPELLDTLTVAVTTLDAFGVDSYRQLYLYVVGTTAENVVRDLRVEDGCLTVGPPTDRFTFPTFLDNEFEANRRALLLADLCYIMRIWQWSTATMAEYLRCPEALLMNWIGRSASWDVPTVPPVVVERIKRLLMIEQARYLLGVSDQQIPAWLMASRPAFAQRTIEELLLGGDLCEFNQVVFWALNRADKTVTIH
jgi:hypothetical protein